MVMESKRLYNIHIYIPSVQELSGFHPIVASQERKHGAKNCSLGTATQRGGDPKKLCCLSTNSSNDIQQSKLSAILEFLKGFSRLKHDETKFNLTLQQKHTKTMALFFKTRTTVKSSISPNWNLWNLVIPNPINGSHMISPDCEVSQPFYD